MAGEGLSNADFRRLLATPRPGGNQQDVAEKKQKKPKPQVWEGAVAALAAAADGSQRAVGGTGELRGVRAMPELGGGRGRRARPASKGGR